MFVDLDIETIPAPNREFYIDAAEQEPFRVPGDMTRERAAMELGLLDYKNFSKEQVLQMWALEFGPRRAEIAGDQAWRATALDGTYGRVLSIAWSVDFEEPTGIIKLNEPELLALAFNVIADDLDDRKPFFIGHNIPWDLKFLYRRAVILGIVPPFDLPFNGRHGQDYFCTSQAWCSHGERIKQDHLARALGLPGKGDMDGSKVCDAWLAGEYGKILEYNMDDVKQNIHIYRRLQFTAKPEIVPGIMYPQ